MFKIPNTPRQQTQANPLLQWVVQNNHPLSQSEEFITFLNLFYVNGIQKLDTMLAQFNDQANLFSAVIADIHEASQPGIEIAIVYKTVFSAQEIIIGRSMIQLCQEMSVSTMLVLSLDLLFDPNQLNKFQLTLFNMNQLLQKTIKDVMIALTNQPQSQPQVPAYQQPQAQAYQQQQMQTYRQPQAQSYQAANNQQPQPAMVNMMQPSQSPQNAYQMQQQTQGESILGLIKKQNKVKPQEASNAVMSPMIQNQPSPAPIENGSIDPNAKISKVRPSVDDNISQNIPDIPSLTPQNLSSPRTNKNKK